MPYKDKRKRYAAVMRFRKKQKTGSTSARDRREHDAMAKHGQWLEYQKSRGSFQVSISR